MSDNENKVNELNEALKGMWDSLSDEQKERAKECKSMDELMALAGKMRIELPDELLETVAGGITWPNSATWVWKTLTCPYCGKSSRQGVRDMAFFENKDCYMGKCVPCEVVYFQADDGSTYDKKGNFLGTFKSGCH